MLVLNAIHISYIGSGIVIDKEQECKNASMWKAAQN